MEKLKIAIVMSGGGSRGSFVMGALEYIQQYVIERIPRLADLEYCVFSGSSTNTFAALMMSMGKHQELTHAWHQLSQNPPVTRNRWRDAWKMLTGATGLNPRSPLEHFIRKYVRLDELRRNVLLHLASFRDGRYFTLGQDDFLSDEDLQNAAIASLRSPGYHQPVSEIVTSRGTLEMVVDGSALRTRPIGEVLAYQPDAIFIISTMPCLPSPLTVSTLRIPGRSDAASLAGAVFGEAAPDALFQRDVNEFIKVNEMVRKAEKEGHTLHSASGRPLRYYDYIVVCPQKHLEDAENYQVETIRKQSNMGFTQAQRAFKASRFMPIDETAGTGTGL